MASIAPVWIMLIVALGLIAASWFLPRKGPNQTLVRSSLMLTFSCCYLMWMIAYMAQLHPILAPRVNLKNKE
ncbi:hypothetical protein PENSPDRAFT_658693 [Peniophora sp. CONT]|nr:hypothetical protein PENSPDRAFT_658693 [Peniophora sp. CONT]